VRCYDASNRDLDSPFALSYHNARAVYGAVNPPKYFAYLWNLPGVPGTSSFNSVGAPNVVSGQTLVFEGVGHAQTHLQVTGYGTTPAYCQPTQPWIVDGVSVIAKDVLCFSATGVPAASPFLATTASSG